MIQMTTDAFGGAVMKLRSGQQPAGANLVLAELRQFAADRPYLTMTLTELTTVHVRLCDMAKVSGPLPAEGEELIRQLRADVSGEAWKIANPASPHLNDPDSVARRDRGTSRSRPGSPPGMPGGSRPSVEYPATAATAGVRSPGRGPAARGRQAASTGTRQHRQGRPR
jgi:hypothetical protein